MTKTAKSRRKFLSETVFKDNKAAKPPGGKGAAAASGGNAKPAKIKFMHPLGRNAKQLQNAAVKKRKKQEQKEVGVKVAHEGLAIYRWFRQELLKHPTDFVCPLELVREWVNRYLARHDDELRLLAKRRHGRAVLTGKEKQLCFQKQVEAEQFNAGIQVPDVTCSQTCTLLRSWKGVTKVTDMKTRCVKAPKLSAQAAHAKPSQVLVKKKQLREKVDVKALTTPQFSTNAVRSRLMHASIQRGKDRRRDVVAKKRQTPRVHDDEGDTQADTDT